jgi:putative hydrolase of the HAD superfamily
LTEEDVRARFGRAFRESEREDLGVSGEWDASGRLRTDERHETKRWRRIVGRVFDDVGDPEACFAELYEHFARPDSWRCFPEVGTTLAALRLAGFRLAIASNFDRRLESVCDGLPELAPIECRVISSIVGHRKPSAHFYRALVQRTGVDAGSVLMVGDDYENDVVGATRAGLQAIELRRNPGREDSGVLATLSGLERLLCRDGGHSSMPP